MRHPKSGDASDSCQGRSVSLAPWLTVRADVGSFRKLGVPYFGVPIIRILLFRVLYWGSLFSETPK